ncbi:hypothetical protein [Chishuiella sp.]|uniref:hypothetical protein n=1 Tax=Chishuiella sp. TaxID=1969467 RepID=UPI0028AF9066|nr:hypothetical protein [Chishuiella sp.]
MQKLYFLVLTVCLFCTKGNAQFFSGKKTFCDQGLNAWYYNVIIDNYNITFKSYSHQKNSYHKNKNRPNEVVKGKIVFGKIVIPLPENCEDCGEEYQAGRFKYSNGFLYDANIEGGYNIYVECNETQNLEKYKEIDFLPNPNELNSIKDNTHYKTLLSIKDIKRVLKSLYKYDFIDTTNGFYTISEYNNICCSIYVEKKDNFNILHYYYNCFDD